MGDLDQGRAPGARLSHVLVLAFVAYAAVQASQIRIRFYDTYDYLNDARTILGDEGPGAAYYRVHAPVMPLLATVGALAHDPADPANRWSWLVPHAMAFGLSLLSLAALAALLARRHRGPGWVVWGLALFVGSPFFVHYSPHLLADIPTAGVVAGSLALWDRVRTDAHWRWPLALGVVWGLAMALKYSLLLLPGPFVLVALLEALADRRVFTRRSARVVLAGLTGLATFFAILAFTYGRIDEAGFSFATWLADLEQASRMVQPMAGEAPSDVLVLLTQIVSPVVLVLAVIGVPRSLRDWRRDLPGMVWMALTVGLLAFSVGHVEGRYLYPAVPVILHLALLGLRTLWRIARTRPRREVARVVLSLALLGAVAPGIVRMVADRDPFYRRPVHQEVAQLLVREIPEEGKVYWSGHFVILAPPDPAPYVHDEFFSFFHLGHPAIHFLTRRQVEGVAATDGQRYLRSRRRPAAFVEGAQRFHHTTDLLAGNPLPTSFTLWIRDSDGAVRAHAFPSGSPE